MTDFERFDPFERRIRDAITEIADTRRPAYLNDILRQTARSAQRPRWTLPERWIPVNRLSLAVAAIAIVLIVAGGAFVLMRGNASTVGGQPTAPPPSASPVAIAAPDVFRSATWIADAPPMAGWTQTDPRIRFDLSTDGMQLTLRGNAAGSADLSSAVVSGGAGELDLLSTKDGFGCVTGNLGRYRSNATADGITVTFTTISDACATRSAALARKWVRALDVHSQGGRGVVAAFDPFLLVSLPPDSYRGPGGTSDGASEIDSPTRTMYVVKNPVGYTVPCAADGGAHKDVGRTIAGFTAYLEGLPGWTVQSESLVIDGKPAVHLTMPSTHTADCPSGRVMDWSVGQSTGGWLLPQGDTETAYLVEVGSDLYLIQWIGDGATKAEELSVVSTIAFGTSLDAVTH